MSGPLRIAHMVSHPIQYLAQLYREFAVYFCSDATLREAHDVGFGRMIAWDSDLVSGCDLRVVRGFDSYELPRRFGERRRALIEGYRVERAAEGTAGMRLSRARAAA